MKLEIITPDKKLFEGSVNSAVFPGSEGSFGVLNNHAPMIATLKAGKVESTDQLEKIQHGVDEEKRLPRKVYVRL